MGRGPFVPFVALVLVAMGLAGCIGGDAAKDQDASPTVSDTAAVAPVTPSDEVTTEVVTTGKTTVEKLTRADLPSWSKGRFWTYAGMLKMADGSHQNLTFSLVVADDASDYVIGTDNANLAYLGATGVGSNDARAWPGVDLFFLGTIAKADLAHSVGGAPSTLFKFPLEDGASWTAADAAGQTVNYRVAHSDQVTVGATRYQGFVVSGTDANGTLLFDYAYLPDAKWFASYTAYDPDLTVEPKHTVKLELTAFGEAFAGEVTTLQTEWLFKKTYRNSVEGNKKETIPVGGGFTKLLVFMDLTAGAGWSDVNGYANATLLDPANQARSHWRFSVVPRAWENLGAATCQEAVRNSIPYCKNRNSNPFEPYAYNHTALLDPTSGDWTLVYAVVTAQGIGFKAGVVGITETATKPGA